MQIKANGRFVRVWDTRPDPAGGPSDIVFDESLALDAAERLRDELDAAITSARTEEVAHKRHSVSQLKADIERLKGTLELAQKDLSRLIGEVGDA